MIELTDEKLMAFLDGELDPKAADSVRRALEINVSARQRAADYQELDQLLRASIELPRGVPDKIGQLLRSSSPNKVFSLGARRIAFQVAGIGSALAASLLIGFLWLSSGVTAPSWVRLVDDGLALSGVVEKIVVATESGRMVRSGNLNVTPILSFVAGDGRSCREVHVHDEELSARLIACHDVDEAEWCIEAFGRLHAPNDGAVYTHAGAAKDPIMDAAYERLKIRSTMDMASERRAISREWKID